ncbi:MAG TPA: SIMPL domain-containing protein [Gemmatimonadaceae bacterium]|nr:SIMPL domain-containing protein [Gemmatimonadaceae bacterium]
MRIIGTAIVVLAIGQNAFAQAAAMGATQPRVPEITASGRGEVPITPDRATVQVSVESRAASAAAAAADNSAKMARVFDALRRSGLAQGDITTSVYTVGQDPRSLRVPPGTPGVPTIPIEFLARNAVRANVRRADDVGKVIDAALAAGATSISSVQFSSPSTDEARRQAISVAVVQAQRDADALAKASGGSLGRLLSMSSTPVGPIGGSYSTDAYFPMAIEAGASMYPTMINPRDLTVVVSVFGRWEFIPGSGH